MKNYAVVCHITEVREVKTIKTKFFDSKEEAEEFKKSLVDKNIKSISFDYESIESVSDQFKNIVSIESKIVDLLDA